MAEQHTKAIRPLPSLAELDTADFWRATKQQRFDYQQCVNCGTVVWHPRAHCTGCVQGELEWKSSAGLGEIYSYSVIRQSYHPFFRTHQSHLVHLHHIQEYVRKEGGYLRMDNGDLVPVAVRKKGELVQLLSDLDGGR